MIFINKKIRENFEKQISADGIKIQNSDNFFDELRKSNPDGKIMQKLRIFGAEIRFFFDSVFSKFGFFLKILI